MTETLSAAVPSASLTEEEVVAFEAIILLLIVPIAGYRPCVDGHHRSCWNPSWGPGGTKYCCCHRVIN